MIKLIRDFIIKHPQWTLFICAVFIRASTIIWGDFVWLDRGDIMSGRANVPLSALPTVFFTRYAETGFYRPIITIILSLLNTMFGIWAPAYHAVSVLVHGGVVVVAYRLFKRVFGYGYKTNKTNKTEKKDSKSREEFFSVAAFIGALIIALHPAAWFAVGAVSNLPDLAMSFFALLSLYYFLRGNSLAIVFALLSFFSKETAIVLVPAWWGVSSVLIGQIRRKHKSIWTLWVGLAAGFAVYALLRFIGVPEVWRVSSVPLTWDEWIGVRVYTLYRMVTTIISPFLPPMGDVTPIEIREIGVSRLIGGIGITIIGGWLLLSRRTSRLVKLLILLGVVSAAPAMNILPLPRFWQLNYAYLPMVWMAAVVGLGIGEIGEIRVIREEEVWLRRMGWLVFIVWLSVSMYSSFAAGLRLRNDRALFETEVLHEPRYREGQYYLGNFYWKTGDLSEAEEHFTRASEDDTSVISFLDYHSAVINLAGVYVGQKRFEEADTLLAGIQDEAYGTNREFVLYNRAAIGYEQGEYAAAKKLLDNLPKPFSRIEYQLLYEKL